MLILTVSDINNFVFDYAAPRVNDDGIEMHLYTQTIFLGSNDSAKNYIEIPRFKTYFAAEGKVFQENGNQFIDIDLFTDSIENYHEIIPAEVM